MPSFGFGFGFPLGNSPRNGGGVVPTPTPAPAGFARNGATNEAATQMLATDTGTIVQVGDSLKVGEGTGSAGPGGFGLGGAALARVGTTLASYLRDQGSAAIDKNYLTGDFGVRGATGNTLLTYDPRWTSLGDGSFITRDDSAAGAAFFHAAAGPAVVTDSGIDTFVLHIADYASCTLYFLIDDAVPASATVDGVPLAAGASSLALTGGGVTRVLVLKAAAVGTHTLKIGASSQLNGIAVVYGADSTKPQINVLTFAACGQSASDMRSTDGIYLRNQITKAAPKVVVIGPGTNDMIQGAANGNTATRKASWLGAIADLVATSRAVGASILLEFPYAFSNVPDATVADWNASLKAYAQAEKLAILSHYDAYGPNAGMDPGLFYRASPRDDHPNKGFSDALGQRVAQAIQAMAG